MAILTLDVGGSAIVLPLQRAQKSDPIDIGEESRAWAGNLRTAVRAQKRVLSVLSTPVDATVEAAVQALFANKAQKACAGDVFNNASASVTCSATVSSEMTQGALLWVLTLTLSEV